MIERINTNNRMSQIVSNGGFIFLSGQVAADTNADISTQTTSVLLKIDGLLKEAATSKEAILSATIYLSSMVDFDAMNVVWDKWFTKVLRQLELASRPNSRAKRSWLKSLSSQQILMIREDNSMDGTKKVKLALYYFDSCPFCRMVLQVLDGLKVDVELRNIFETPQHRTDLIKARGRAMVPVLRITTNDDDRWMPESRDISRYLQSTYG